MSKKKDLYQIFDEPKKKKKKKHQSDNGYNHNDSEKIAEQMNDFIHDISMLVIILGKKYDDIKKAKKRVKEAIEDLNAGKEEKVFDEDGYEAYLRGQYK